MKGEKNDQINLKFHWPQLDAHIMKHIMNSFKLEIIDGEKKVIMQFKLELELEFENRHNREVQWARESDRLNTKTKTLTKLFLFSSKPVLPFFFNTTLPLLFLADLNFFIQPPHLCVGDLRTRANNEEKIYEKNARERRETASHSCTNSKDKRTLNRFRSRKSSTDTCTNVFLSLSSEHDCDLTKKIKYTK